MESDDNISGEFQRSTRMPLDAVVRLHFQGTVAYQNGFAANVSATGMFVKHPAPPPLGTQLVFEFNLGAERKPVQGAGEVVWVRDKYLGPGQPAGVGIRFLQLDSQSRDHIAEALFEFLEQSLTEDSLLDSSGYSFESASATVSATSAAAEPAYSGAPPPTPLSPGTYAPAAVAMDEKTSPAGAIDFAELERLPRIPVSPAPPPPQVMPGDGKRAFSVFSSLDEADSQTADIVREALKEDLPLPMMSAAAAASSGREGSRGWLGALVVLALAVGGGYLAWREWGANWLAQRSARVPATAAATPEAAAPAARRPDPLTGAPAPGKTLAETVGVDANSISPAAAPPQRAPASAPSDEPSDVAVAEQESAEATAAAPANASPPPASAAPADPGLPRPPVAAAPAQVAQVAPLAPLAPVTPSAPNESSADANAARAERLTGIEWRDAGTTAGETVLVLAGDGAFATGTFSYSEIGGENPRVLIKLKGMQSPYRGPAPRAPQVGGALVKGVRTGFHVTPSGSEIHVVVDLARGGVKVLALEPQSAGLTLRLAL